MTKKFVIKVGKVKEPVGLHSKVELRPRNAKMDAFIRTVRSSPRYEVAAAAAAVSKALTSAHEEAYA